MSIVVDCSVAMSWAMPDEGGQSSESALDQVLATGGVVPTIFRLEVGNALLVAQRRKRITADFLAQALGRISLLPLVDDAESSQHVWSSSIDMAAAHGLSLYDATYLELAKRRRFQLATFDKQLAQAAKSEGVALSWPST